MWSYKLRIAWQHGNNVCPKYKVHSGKILKNEYQTSDDSSYLKQLIDCQNLKFVVCIDTNINLTPSKQESESRNRSFPLHLNWYKPWSEHAFFISNTSETSLLFCI